MVNSGEVPINAVRFNGAKMLSGPDQNGEWPGARAQRSLAADDAPPAERHDLPHVGLFRERVKPVALPRGTADRETGLRGCG